MSDINAGLAAGAKPILVLTGYGKKERSLMDENITCAANLVEASTLIISKVS
jgi:phosphoglycolate phosphatase-like HAD superfamily hydrolase